MTTTLHEPPRPPATAPPAPAGSSPGAWNARDARFVAARLVIQALTAVTVGIASWVLPQLADREWPQFLGYSLLAVALEALVRFLRDNRAAPLP